MKGQMELMRYARIAGAGRPLVLENGPVPDTPVDGVLVRTLYGGVCHSDLYFIQDEIPIGDGKVFRHRDIIGEDGFQRVVPGHEICGRVQSLGAGVPVSAGVQVDDIVLVCPWVGCGTCPACQAGDTNMCPHNKGGTTDIGQSPTSPGGYGSHVAVPHWKFVVKVPYGLPPEVACLLPCSALTTYNALRNGGQSIKRAANVYGEAKLLIIDLGGLGIWALKLAQSVIKEIEFRIAVLDKSADKIRYGKRNGADEGFHWTDEMSVDDIRELVNSGGKYDACIDFVGNEETADVGFASLNHGGTLVTVGLAGSQMKFSSAIMVAKSLRIQGVRTGTVEDLRQLVELVATGRINLPPVIICRLEDINTTLEQLKEGRVLGRAVIQHQ